MVKPGTPIHFVCLKDVNEKNLKLEVSINTANKILWPQIKIETHMCSVYPTVVHKFFLSRILPATHTSMSSQLNVGGNFNIYSVKLEIKWAENHMCMEDWELGSGHKPRMVVVK